MGNSSSKSSFAPFLFSCVFLSFSCPSFGEFSATISAATDYIWRGYSRTDGDVAVQANFEYEHALGFYLGTSVVNVDFGDNSLDNEANVEITPYLGWAYSLADDLRIDMQWTRYIYDGNIFGRQSDYNEFYLFLHYRDILTARASFSEDYYHQGHASGDYGLTARYPATSDINVSASVGYSQVEKTLEYDILYWDVGFTYYYQFAAFDFRYMDATYTTEEFLTSWAYHPNELDPTFVFSISVGF